MSYVNVDVTGADVFPARSTDRAVTVYVTPLVRALVASGTNHVEVPVAGRVDEATCQVVPDQNRLSLERWIVTPTLATPEGVSAAVPQMRAVAHPAFQRAVL